MIVPLFVTLSLCLFVADRMRQGAASRGRMWQVAAGEDLVVPLLHSLFKENLRTNH
jgi:hypothetical protein